ncbi:hypothetical protein KIM67_03285, partial [Flagellimonas sp. 389]|uniref:DUF6443 domain-containing protein n=1 Tax=Flagellimonas sp. 389 TaxID=2835862 RepID=UPI001D25F1E5
MQTRQYNFNQVAKLTVAMFIFLSIPTALWAQIGGGQGIAIAGPTTATSGGTRNYTIFGPSNIVSTDWSTSSGATVQSSNSVNAVIRFNDPGTRTISAVSMNTFNNFYTDDHTVTVTGSPSVPPLPAIIKYCGYTRLKRTNPPSGVTYYWQSSSSGTSTSNSASSVNRSSGSVYYLRARSSAGLWSSARSINYTIDYIPSTPSTPSVTKNCGNTVLTRVNPPSGVTWYWQSSSSGTSTSSASSSVTRNSGTVYYLRPRNNSSGCWGTARTVNYTVNVVPGTPPTPTVTNNCGYSRLTRANHPVGITYYWQSSSSGTSTANSSQSVNRTVGSTYYLRAQNNASGCWSNARTVSYNVQQLVTYYDDSDGDGFGDPAMSISSCNQPANYVPNNLDQCPDSYGTNNGCSYVPPTLSDENYVYVRKFQIRVNTLSNSSQIKNSSDVIEEITYYDGLGRGKQNVLAMGNPDGKDLVTYMEYDAIGRVEKEYLPYAADGSVGHMRSTSKTDTHGFYTEKYNGEINSGSPNPYSQKEFEPSPLSRILKQAAPGHDWRMGGGHEIEFAYKANVTNEVRRFSVSFTGNNPESPQLVQNGYRTKGELHKTVTKDENHDGTASKLHTTEEFTDKLGRVVLKRTYAEVGSPSAVEAHDTYYVYDDYGNLTYVIPPKVTTASVSGTELNELCYQYKYDHRNRLVEKKVPGKDPEEIVYNTLDQPVLTRHANLQADGKWLFTKYDALGRVVLTGILSSNMTRSQAQTNVENATAQYEEKVGQGYTDNAYPKISVGSPAPQVHTINFYDNYNFPLLGYTIPTDVLGQTVSQNVKGLPTGGSILVLDGNNDKWIGWARAYDEKGRMIAEGTLNDYLDTFDQMETKLDFVGRPLQTVTTHTKGANPAIVTTDDFEYDHMGRLTKQTQTMGAHTETLTENTYDELGQLVQKKVGGNLQTVDYEYNVRGWLKRINDPSSMGNDLFAFGINYNTADHGGAPLYNGNIAETEWRTANVDNGLKWYRYGYDALNRITNATNSSANYDLDLVEYDKNGNITKLERKGHTNAGATTFGNMDRLIYYYHTDSNQIRKVTDFWNDDQGFKDGTNTNNDFEYDANGNMTSDLNKGISSIEYNHLNLPTKV